MKLIATTGVVIVFGSLAVLAVLRETDVVVTVK